jgi:glutathione gamma-glutamylcysteinyltransferase
MSSGGMESYFKLAGQYHNQSEPAYSSLAVLCMVLNGLSIDPARIWKSPWRWYRYLWFFSPPTTISEEMLGCCLSLEDVRKKGLDFDNFSKLASCNGAEITSFRANERYFFFYSKFIS